LQQGGPPQTLRLSKGTAATLAARAEADLKAMLARAGALSVGTRRPSSAGPRSPDERYLDVQSTAAPRSS